MRGLAELTAALARHDRADDECPARKRNLGGKEKCPRCRAGLGDSCGLAVYAAITFVAEARALIAKMEADNA